MTEWNGFQLLNGTAGDQVGPEPVFKISSSGEFLSEINFSPVTKNVSENVAQHELVFSSSSPAIQELTFGDFSSGTGLTFDITTRGSSGLDPLRLAAWVALNRLSPLVQQVQQAVIHCRLTLLGRQSSDTYSATDICSHCNHIPGGCCRGFRNQCSSCIHFRWTLCC